jgi:RNA polymerase sigma-70 factor (ECF subfamily)
VDEDRELARAFAEHQAWAYEAAYRIHGRLLYATALDVSRNAQDAQDCVHDVFVRLWRRSDAFWTARGSLRAFLAVCVRNEALTRARNARNRERIAQSHGAPPADADIAAGVVRRESVRLALQRLPEKQRQTVALAYFGHLTHEEIASQLGEPIGTVKSRLASALRRLRESFTSEGAVDA